MNWCEDLGKGPLKKGTKGGPCPGVLCRDLPKPKGINVRCYYGLCQPCCKHAQLSVPSLHVCRVQTHRPPRGGPQHVDTIEPGVLALLLNFNLGSLKFTLTELLTQLLLVRPLRLPTHLATSVLPCRSQLRLQLLCLLLFPPLHPHLLAPLSCVVYFLQTLMRFLYPPAINRHFGSLSFSRLSWLSTRRLSNPTP